MPVHRSGSGTTRRSRFAAAGNSSRSALAPAHPARCGHRGRLPHRQPTITRPRLGHDGHGRRRPRRPGRPAARHARRADRRRGRQQPPGQRRLGDPLEQRRQVGLRQGHRRHVLHEPLLRPAVQRLVQRRHDPRRVPLRDPGHHERRHPGQLLRGPRGRLVPGRQDAAGRARHRVEPVRRRLLRQDRGRHGHLDPRLREHVQGTHRPRRRHLHGDQLVDRAAPATTRGFAATNPLWVARYNTDRRAHSRPAGATTRSGSTRRPARTSATTTSSTAPSTAYRHSPTAESAPQRPTGPR